ncbi:pirin family protein [Marinovum sp.]|uniref:pirin family protein n=1 Tax=Marinovum sp. TaxID=2024839 RepID=UPI003A90BCFD
MITIHEKTVRGHTRGGWLDSFHTFSFGTFQDPMRMGFGNLRVLNEDRIIPGAGFPMHDHADMDILTYVTKGQLRHEDSQGNVSVINAGEAQLMSAGDGVAHSEYNASDSESAHLLQIWLIPDHSGGVPSYAQTKVPEAGDVLLAGPATSGALLPLGSQTTVTLIRAGDGETTDLARPGADRFVHVLDGLGFAEGERLSAGDGLQIPSGETTSLDWATEGAALLFTMPAPRRRLH